MSGHRSRTALLLVALAVPACSVSPLVEDAAAANDENTATNDAIVNGVPSTAEQDSTVLLTPMECTGTLIAPNLVLTARHCVARLSDYSDCPSFEPAMSAGDVAVTLGVDANTHEKHAARGSKLFLPPTSNLCSFDIALVELDRDIPDANIAKVRFSELRADEPVTAVGYGSDGTGRRPAKRMQRTTTVLGVGPTRLAYTTRENETIEYDVPQGDVSTGESSCHGDSGGPLFDAEGAVVAVTSRVGHGRAICVDAPILYAGVRHHEAMIRNAAEAAGHPLPP